MSEWSGMPGLVERPSSSVDDPIIPDASGYAGTSHQHMGHNRHASAFASYPQTPRRGETAMSYWQTPYQAPAGLSPFVAPASSFDNPNPPSTPWHRPAATNMQTSWSTDNDWPQTAAHSPYPLGGGFISISNPATPLRRTASLAGGTVSASGPRETYKRPEDWRRDFRLQRTGISRLFSPKTNKKGFTRNLLSIIGITQIHPKVEFKTPPVFVFDLRTEPSTARIFPTRRPLAALELQEAITDPPLQRMVLFHQLLPWDILVEVEYPQVITISQVLWAIYFELQRPITQADYYCDEVDEANRIRIYDAWEKRCNGNQMEVMKGVKRVDFLGDRYMMEGLKKKDDVWEIKTTVPSLRKY